MLVIIAAGAVSLGASLMRASLLGPGVESYFVSLASYDDPLLLAMEARARSEKFPIIGPVAGSFCYLITRICAARRVFAMGSGFGYSTLWFARAVADNGGGEVYHTFWDSSLSQQAQAYFHRAGLPSSVRVSFITGDARAILHDTEAVDLIKKRLRSGGVFIFANMLWSGRSVPVNYRDQGGQSKVVPPGCLCVQPGSDPRRLSRRIPTRLTYSLGIGRGGQSWGKPSLLAAG